MKNKRIIWTEERERMLREIVRNNSAGAEFDSHTRAFWKRVARDFEVISSLPISADAARKRHHYQIAEQVETKSEVKEKSQANARAKLTTDDIINAIHAMPRGQLVRVLQSAIDMAIDMLVAQC